MGARQEETARVGSGSSLAEFQVVAAGGEDRDGWERFIAETRRGTLCHSFAWKQVFSRAYRKQVHYLCARRAGRIEGVLPLVWMPGPIGGRCLVSLPFLDRGGVVADSAAASAALLESALELAARLGARGLDLRGGLIGSHGAPEDGTRYSLILPLPDTEEALWQAIGPKVRNQVRKSSKAGLATARAPHDQLGRFYRVFAHNMRDLGSPVHSRTFFAEILAAFGPAAGLYLTSDSGGAVIGGAIALHFGGTVTVPWASSLRSARRHCPNHSLYWRILRDSQAAGASLFDFGRSRRGSGTFHFKKQWGATPEGLCWVSLGPDGGQHPTKLTDHSRLTLLSKAWTRLPVGVANRLGPLVRRHLSL